MIDLFSLRGESFFVLGLGKSGQATAQAFGAAGINYRAWDDKEDIRAAFIKQKALSDPEKTDFSQFNAMVLAPGISSNHDVAKKSALPIICDVDLLARVRADATFVGITGTNGKSTTTALTGHILQAETGGNLGTPALALANTADTYVLELSSYQLERCPHLACDVAVHLNITPDHLERHGNLEGYTRAKENLFNKSKGPKVAIVGIDDEPSRGIAARINNWNLYKLSIGNQALNGYSVIDGILTGPEGNIRMNLKLHERLKGAHNWQNMAAAWAVAENLDTDADVIQKRMLSFAGLPHRQFMVKHIGAVSYINDSKATNADAAAKALDAYDNIYWIIGGLSKTGGLNGLEKYRHKIVHAYLIGQASDEFAVWLDAYNVPYTKCETLDHAVQKAHTAAQAADKSATVLLSPACASWDQFDSFEHRGMMFERYVHALPNRLAA